MLDSIDITMPAGLRDRALIALMVYSFARVGAALAMKVEDVFVQNRRLWDDMIRRRAKAASIATPIGNHSFRATGTFRTISRTPSGRWKKPPQWRTMPSAYRGALASDIGGE